MGVLNLAQGTLYMIGAYVGWSAFVRPDTLVDILTPLALLAAGLLLTPLFERPLAQLKVSPAVGRIWPWLGLLLAAVILFFTITNAPIAMWDREQYDESPIVWTQNFDMGRTVDLLEPARFEKLSPLLGLGGIFLGGVLAAVSLVGLGRRGRPGGGMAAARPQGLPWGTIIPVCVLLILGIVAYLANDALTAALFTLDSTWLFLIAMVVATLTGAGLGALMESTLIRPSVRPTHLSDHADPGSGLYRHRSGAGRSGAAPSLPCPSRRSLAERAMAARLPP